MRAICAAQTATRLAALVLVLSLGISCHAAVGDDVFAWPNVDWSDLKPYQDFKHKHEFFYQVPENPRAVVFLAHGCVHSAHNYWPQSEECPECRGLPEELSHTLQALKLGYAVIAISSLDRETGCWSFWDDCFDVIDIIQEWREDWGLDHLPIYGCGISSGGSFVLKLPRYMKFDGLMSEALGIDPLSGGFRDVPGVYPPTVIVSMQRDKKQRELINENREILEGRNTPVEIIKSYARQVYPTYFSERFPLYISEELSIKIRDGLEEIAMIDGDGNVLEDPRYTSRPWLKELQEVVPEVQGKTESFQGRTVPRFPEMSEDVALPGLMNLAYNLHEIISDYFTPTLIQRVEMQSLLDQYTPAELEAKDVARTTPPATPDTADATTSSTGGTGSSPDAASSSGSGSSNMVAIIGGAVGGAVGTLILVALVWWCMRRRKIAREAAVMMPSTMHAVHIAPAAGVTAQVSLVGPGLKERFELTEVVEQTGSPSSARRRMRTAFQGSPRKGASPRKNAGK
ncbi:hypothetical protein CHLNCDRAFT_134385 [Chlorella variabilis]|uniref:Peptidase S9 prolyl oligopeptidase catalytic domain-containing protein n=1 Tax=Chlorella variabilis TaxID=554065 RepID=E1ZFW3_CHLVA|nr:hypothetical protein CHLNCDRAFT_134385 [Chlorella variabilis]EFN55356.1 hypothetical protein CHLNCDRAFT_134385 [Chlorella variabilis]|eukprot:XP_005847458.1 hypothetical protein CHLNCDRAFT_134385 [Chlorella variabilis]